MTDIERKEKTAEFIAAAGLFVVAADEEMLKTEMEVLRGILSNLVTDPEVYIYYNGHEAHLDRTLKICNYWAETPGDYKNSIWGVLVGIAMCDGLIHPKEREMLYKVAKMTRVDEVFVEMMLGDYTKYLGSK